MPDLFDRPIQGQRASTDVVTNDGLLEESDLGDGSIIIYVVETIGKVDYRIDRIFINYDIDEWICDHWFIVHGVDSNGENIIYTFPIGSSSQGDVGRARLICLVIQSQNVHNYRGIDQGIVA